MLMERRRGFRLRHDFMRRIGPMIVPVRMDYPAMPVRMRVAGKDGNAV
jgi:hypothetical protein